MKGIASRKKTFVAVVVHVSEDGLETPLSIEWRDGRRFDVERVLERRPAASMRTGGRGIRYTVRIGGKSRELWEDENHRWFVEEIVAEMP